MGIESFYNIYNTAKDYGVEALDKSRRFKEWQAKKYHDFQKWQKDMGYYDDRSVIEDISDWAGITGTDAPAFDPQLRGTGKKDSLIFKKIPEAWKSYDTEKIAEEKPRIKQEYMTDEGIELTPFADKVLRTGAMIQDTVKWPLNAAQGVVEFLPDMPHFTKTAAQEAHKFLDKNLDPFNLNKNRNISSPQGTGAWWTKVADDLGGSEAWYAKLARAISFGSIVPTNMKRDSEEFVKSAYPTFLKEDGTPFDPIKDKAYEDAGGGIFRDRNLNNWPLYQTFKSGRGWDTADDRRINKRVEATMKNKPIPPDEILQDFYTLARENMDTALGQNGVTGAELVASPEAVNYYFKQYFDLRKEGARNDLRNQYEFQAIGQDFADWMSTNYRNESIKKFGMYPTFDEYEDQLEVLTQDISPFENAPANLSLANKDYIDALKAGKEDIGEPLEWSYGAYDKSPGYGIPEEHKDWFEYNTKEAEKLFESNQAVAAEFAALYFARAPLALRKPIQNWLQTTKTGRAIRELMPGLFQHGSRANFGLRKFATKTAAGDRNWWYTALNVPAKTIDFLRPKGGQMLGAIALGEMGSNWERN